MLLYCQRYIQLYQGSSPPHIYPVKGNRKIILTLNLVIETRKKNIPSLEVKLHYLSKHIETQFGFIYFYYYSNYSLLSLTQFNRLIQTLIMSNLYYWNYYYLWYYCCYYDYIIIIINFIFAIVIFINYHIYHRVVFIIILTGKKNYLFKYFLCTWRKLNV